VRRGTHVCVVSGDVPDRADPFLIDTRTTLADLELEALESLFDSPGDFPPEFLDAVVVPREHDPAERYRLPRATQHAVTRDPVATRDEVVKRRVDGARGQLLEAVVPGRPDVQNLGDLPGESIDSPRVPSAEMPLKHRFQLGRRGYASGFTKSGTSPIPFAPFVAASSTRTDVL